MAQPDLLPSELPDLETLAPILGQLTFGALAGFAAGYALKKIGKVAAVALGIFSSFWPITALSRSTGCGFRRALIHS